MLPITPMKAQIKSQPNFDSTKNSTSLVSSDLQRVKVEIGRDPSNSYRVSPSASPHSQLGNFAYQHQLAMTTTTTPSKELTNSPKKSKEEHFHPNLPGRVQFDRDTHHHLSQVASLQQSRYPLHGFASPQKRFLDEFDSNSPVAKRHRLSLDSRVGMMERERAARSPFPPTLQHQQQQQHQNLYLQHRASPIGNSNPAHRRSSFSIDSIISKSEPRDYPADPPSPEPVKMVKPVTSQPESSRIVVPITPYSMRGLDPQTQLSFDPRVAHLAGIAANPHLGLSQIGNLMNNPFYAQFLAMNSQIMAPSGTYVLRFIGLYVGYFSILASENYLRTSFCFGSTTKSILSQSGYDLVSS